jgi:tetratricopeptide (TPR) repeat protein
MSKRKLARGAVALIAVLVAAVVAWWSYHLARTRAHWQQALVTLEQQDFPRSHACLAPCVAWWRDDLEVRLRAASAARLAQQYDEAEALLAFCEQRADTTRDAVRRERALLQVEQGDFQGHLEFLAPRGPRDPKLSAETLDALAHGLAHTFFTSTALECLGRLLDQDPDHVRGNLLAGDIHTQMKYPEQAVPHFERAVQRLPHVVAPRLRLAECLLMLGQTQQAAGHLRFLRDNCPDEPAVGMARARLHVYRAELEEAKRLLDEVLARHADDVDALVERGTVEFHHGDPQRALSWLERAVAINPDRLEAWSMLANCHEALGRTEPKQRCQDQVARINREVGEALRRSLTVIQERPTNLELRADVADCWERLHEPDKAIGWRFCVLQVDAGHRPTHMALARLLQAQGQPHRAARHRALAGQEPIP